MFVKLFLKEYISFKAHSTKILCWEYYYYVYLRLKRDFPKDYQKNIL